MQPLNRYIFIFLISFIRFSTFAQTFVPAGIEVSGKWVRDSSPYVVLGEVTVPVGQKLTIERGVEVQFKVFDDSARYGESRAGMLMVKGRLMAIGTEKDRIVFTRQGQNGNWGVIFVDSTSRGSSFDHCVVKHAGSMNDVRHESVNYGGLSFFGAGAEVWNTILMSNRTYGVTCHGGASPAFYNCLIVGNYGAGVGVFSGNPAFEKSTIADNSSEGVYCHAEASPVFKKTVIIGNGGTVRNGMAHLTHCILDARPFGKEVVWEDTVLVNPGPDYLDWVLGTKPHELMTQWANKGIGAPFFKDAGSIGRLTVFLRAE